MSTLSMLLTLMHEFTELIDRCAHFSLESLDKVNVQTTKNSELSASTVSIKNLQMTNLNKVILAVGMFSIFEAHLQTNLNCTNGFSEAKKYLDKAGESELKSCLSNFILAINVLKHGKGRSYEALVTKADRLPFRVKMPDEGFFNEGDVSEISTLIEVDNDFVELCSKTIEDISRVLRKSHEGFY